MKKRVIWGIALALLMGLLTASASADAEWTYRVKDGVAWLTGYTGSASSVTLPQTVDGVPVYGLEDGALPDSILQVTVPVSVGDIGGGAIPLGALIRARHGAYALEWAKENGRDAENISQPGFTSLVVDLTGSDYRRTADGYSLGKALGKALRPGVALYIPDTGKAWGVNSLTEEKDRYLALVEEADMYLTYQKVLLSNNGPVNGLHVRDDGVAVFTFNMDNEVRVNLNPTYKLSGGLTAFVTLRNVEVDIQIDTAAVSMMQTGGYYIMAWNLAAVLAKRPDRMIDTSMFIERCYIHGEWDQGIAFSTPPNQLVGELEFMGPRVPLGSTGFTLSPMIFLQYAQKTAIAAEFGYEHTQFTIDFDNRHLQKSLNGGFSVGTPFFRTPGVNDISFSVNAGVALDFGKLIQVAEIVQNLSFESKTENAFEVGYAATRSCMDVTWDVKAATQLTFNPGIDLKRWKTNHLKLNAYAQWEYEVEDAYNLYIGATLGSITSLYITKEIGVTQLDWPRTIKPLGGTEYVLESGETAHFEPDWYGDFKKVEKCTKRHALHFDPALEGMEPFDVDCSRIENVYDWRDEDRQLTAPGKTFNGWYTEEGDKFFDQVATKYHPDTWDGTKTLTARWTDDGYYEGSPYWYDSRYHTATDQVYAGISIYSYDDPDGVTRTYYIYGSQNIADPVSYIDHDFDTMSAEDLIKKYGDYYGNTCLVNTDPYYDKPFKLPEYKNYRAMVNGVGSANLVNLAFNQRVYRIGEYVNCPNLETVKGNGHLVNSGVFAKCFKLRSVTGMEGIVTVDDFAFAHCFALPAFSLPQTVRTIGNNAFLNCWALTRIDLPEGLKSIGEAAFKASGITSATIPASVETVGKGAFADCKALETVYWTGDKVEPEERFDHSGVRELTIEANQLGSIYFNADNLDQLETLTIRAQSGSYISLERLPNLKTVTIDVSGGLSGVTVSECPSLTALELRASNMEYDLYITDCDSLTTVNVSGLAQLRSLHVSNCAQLTGITLEELAQLEELYVEECGSLETLKVSGMLGYVSIVRCPRLQTLELGPVALGESPVCVIGQLDSLTRFDLADGSAAATNSSYILSISSCPSLTDVTVPMETPMDKVNVSNCPYAEVSRRASAVSTGNATTLMHFDGQFGRENEDMWLVPGSEFTLFAPQRAYGNGSYWRVFRGWALNGDTAQLKQAGDTITVPAKESTLYSIYDQRLYSADIRDGVLYGYERYANDGSTLLTVPDGVTGLAAGCVGEKETTVYISRLVSTVDSHAFDSAVNLQAIEVDPKNKWFRSEDGALYTKGGKLVCVPAALTADEFVIAAGTKTIGENAFYGEGRNGLVNVFIPDSVTALEDGWYTGILNCPIYGPVDGPVAAAAEEAGLNYNIFPVYFISEGHCVAVGAVKAGTELPPTRKLKDDGTFLGWSLEEGGEVATGPVVVPYGGMTLFARWLTRTPPEVELALPEGLLALGEEAFAGSNVRSVKVPASVKTIGPRAFANCARLETLYIAGRNTEIDPTALSGAPATLTVWGFTGSTAEAFAKARGFTFAALD